MCESSSAIYISVWADCISAPFSVCLFFYFGFTYTASHVVDVVPCTYIYICLYVHHITYINTINLQTNTTSFFLPSMEYKVAHIIIILYCIVFYLVCILYLRFFFLVLLLKNAPFFFGKNKNKRIKTRSRM